MTAIIVDKEKDLEIFKSVDQIKENLEMNIKTHFEYIKIIKDKLYSNNGKIMSYGIKLVPGNISVIEITNLLNYLNK